MPAWVFSHWDIFVSAFCGVMLFLFLLALVFVRDFREDLVAAKGKTNVFDVLSVEGAVVVIIAALLFVGLLYPVYDQKNKLAEFLAGLPFEETDKQVVREKIDALVEEKNRLEKHNSSLAEDVAMLKGFEYFLGTLETIEPEGERALRVRGVAESGRGPWAPYQISDDVIVSIPKGLKTGHELYSCPEHLGKHIVLIDHLDLASGGGGGGHSIEAVVNGKI